MKHRTRRSEQDGLSRQRLVKLIDLHHDSMKLAEGVMQRHGWASMPEAGVALLGMPLANVRLAQRGDLVLSPDATSFGVCLGAQVAFLAPEGLTLRALTFCVLAWKI